MDWQGLWYYCCWEEPDWALQLADYPEVDTHADGENGYALLVRAGHFAAAEQLAVEHGVDWETLRIRCQNLEVLKRISRRRVKSARTGTVFP